MANYKLRIYKLFGSDRGNLDHEEFFSTHESMDQRYKEIFRNIRQHSLRPTAWEYKEDDWERIAGY